MRPLEKTLVTPDLDAPFPHASCQISGGKVVKLLLDDDLGDVKAPIWEASLCKIRRRRRKVTPTKQREIPDLRRNGVAVKEIAHATGLRLNTVYNLLRESRLAAE